MIAHAELGLTRQGDMHSLMRLNILFATNLITKNQCKCRLYEFYKGVERLNFIKKIFVIFMFLFINNLALGANIDFNKLNNMASRNCTVHLSENCVNANEPNAQCLPRTSNESSAEAPCANVKTEDNYVEPKFSTKKPRGQ